jgi:hypothetical protein
MNYIIYYIFFYFPLYTVKRTSFLLLMNPWLQHVKAYRATHPSVSYRDALKQAKSTYTKTKKGKGIFGSVLDVGLGVALGPLAVVPFLDPRNMVKAGKIMGEHQTTNEGRRDQDQRLLKTLIGFKIGGGVANDVWKKGRAFIKKNPKLILSAVAEVKKVIDSPNKIKLITDKLNRFITKAIN